LTFSADSQQSIAFELMVSLTRCLYIDSPYNAENRGGAVFNGAVWVHLSV